MVSLVVNFYIYIIIGLVIIFILYVSLIYTSWFQEYRQCTINETLLYSWKCEHRSKWVTWWHIIQHLPVYIVRSLRFTLVSRTPKTLFSGLLSHPSLGSEKKKGGGTHKLRSLMCSECNRLLLLAVPTCVWPSDRRWWFTGGGRELSTVLNLSTEKEEEEGGRSSTQGHLWFVSWTAEPRVSVAEATQTNTLQRSMRRWNLQPAVVTYAIMNWRHMTAQCRYVTKSGLLPS